MGWSRGEVCARCNFFVCLFLIFGLVHSTLFVLILNTYNIYLFFFSQKGIIIEKEATISV